MDVSSASHVANKNILLRCGCVQMGSSVAFTPLTPEHEIIDANGNSNYYLNEVLRNECLSTDSFTEVYIAKNDGFLLDQHVELLYDFLLNNYNKTIIYTNLPGGVAFEKIRGGQKIKFYLRKIAKDFPETREIVARLLLPLESIPEFSSTEEPSDSIKLQNVLSNKLSMSAEYLFSPMRRLIARKALTLQQQLFMHSMYYDDPSNGNLLLRPAPTPDKYFTHQEDAEYYLDFFKLFAVMAKSRSSTFVFYIPPHVNVDKQEYDTYFKPMFVDRIRNELKPYTNALVIDNSNLTSSFTASDLEPFGGYKLGYNYYSTGKLKAARLLITSLLDAKLLSGFRAPLPVEDTLGVSFRKGGDLLWAHEGEHRNIEYIYKNVEMFPSITSNPN